MAITLKELKDMISDKGVGTRIGRFRDLRTQQRDDKKFYNLNYEIKIHEDFRKIKLPTARQMVDTAVSHLPLSKPVIEVIPFKDTNPIIAKALKQQDYYTALLLWNMQQVNNIIQTAGKDLFIRGEAYIKTLWDEDVLGATAEELKEMSEDNKHSLMLEKMPLRMLCPDPMNCYPHPDHIDCRPVDIIETYDILAEQIHRIWPKWKPGTANNVKVKFTEYWSAQQVCFLANGEPVTNGIEDNPYKEVPYNHVYSGYGHRDTEATPESQAVSLLTYARGVIEQQCRYHSYLDKATSFASMPILILPGSKEDYEEGGKKLVPKPGDVYYMGDNPGEQPPRIEWVAPNLPAGIMNAIGVTEGLLSKVQPGVVRGETPQGIESGYPMALMIGEARLQFGLPLQNLQTLVARSLEQVRLLIRDVAQEEVPIWGEKGVIKLSPDDCEGAFRVNVEFDASTPEARATRALSGQRLRQGGSISLYTELKDYHNIKNPGKEINRINAESLMKHPALQRMVAVKAVRELEGEQAAMAIQQAMVEGEAGAIRKASSSGVPVGGETEAELPEDVLASTLGRRGKALRAETEAGV